jgi:hypothetical protein
MILRDFSIVGIQAGLGVARLLSSQLELFKATAADTISYLTRSQLAEGD